MTTVYTPLQYGWDVVYWLRIEGVPLVWIERTTTLSRPSWAAGQDDSLVIDVSAPIGSEVEYGETVGKALRLSWRLRDSAAARGYVAAPSVVTRLDEDVTYTETSIDVDDASGLGVDDLLHVGPEVMGITGVAGNTLTVVRTDSPYRYPHAVGTIATDQPRYWRGRTVWLYASPIDPTGHMPGSALDDNADLVWVGQIDDGPLRVESAFEWSALSIDRLLARPTILEIAGTVQSTQPYFAVDPGWTATVRVEGLTSLGAEEWGYTVVLTPFAAVTANTLYSSDQLRQAIVDEWDAETTAQSATELGDFVWIGSDLGGWSPRISVGYDAQVAHIATHTDWGAAQPMLQFVAVYGGNSSQIVHLLPGQLLQPDVRVYGQGYGGTGLRSLVIDLDEGDASDITTPGVVRIAETRHRFDAAGEINGLAVLGDLTRLSGPEIYPLQAPGLEAEIVLDDSGEPGEVMLRALQSSGTTNLRGIYDTLAGGQGLGIPYDLMDEDSFLALVLPELSIESEGTWAETFGGLLDLLSRAALADRGELKIISTSPAGSLPAATIDNDALMSRKGSPVVSLTPAKTPTRIVVQHGEDFRIVYTDQAGGIARGTTEVELEVPIANREQLASFATPLVAARFAGSQTLQILRLRVAPWLEVYPGDLVRLDISGADVWSWSTSSSDLTGVARCTGRVMDIEDHVVELTLIADASVSQPALCPSAEVSTWSTSPTQPGAGDTIDVPAYFYEHFSAILAQSAGTFNLIAYDPGDSEGVTDGYTIDAVALVSSVCRLTIDAVNGSPTLTADQTRLTHPDEGSGTDEQDDHAHVLDGGYWS